MACQSSAQRQHTQPRQRVQMPQAPDEFCSDSDNQQRRKGLREFIAQKVAPRGMRLHHHHGHRTTEEFFRSATGGILDEVFERLAEDDVLDIISNLVAEQTYIVLKGATSREGRCAVRTAASEWVKGSYDAMMQERKRFFHELSKTNACLVYVLVGLLLALLVGIVMALWRFVLLGSSPALALALKAWARNRWQGADGHEGAWQHAQYAHECA